MKRGALLLNGDTRAIVAKIQECDGEERLRDLRGHADDEIARCADDLLRSHFCDDDGMGDVAIENATFGAGVARHFAFGMED